MFSLHSFVQTTLITLLPPRCGLCKQTIEKYENNLPLCQCCQADLTQFSYQVGNFVVSDLLMQPDIKKGFKQIQFNRLFSFAPYTWPYDQWISGLKFSAQYTKAKLLAQLLANRLKQQYKNRQLPQVILPMPIHTWRRLSRGYNQAELIAKVIAKKLNMPLDCHRLKRIKSTKAQTSLGQKARKSNVKGAFEFSNNQYHHVALLDDVITTGSTVNEVCKVLKRQGVTQIDVWTICATPK